MSQTKDELEFGHNRWVYCASHVGPHTTGWCTVPVREKTLLAAQTREDALAEVRAMGLPIYGE